ncbi:hypothetical protein B7463_g3399, partial [Scytalidium lignicola]
MRFYVRQNPKLTPNILKEAVGFFVDTENSLPSELSVDDWSSLWNRSESRGGSNSSLTYLLDFEIDHLPLSSTSIPVNDQWESELFGVLQLSEKTTSSDYAPKNLILLACLQRTSLNLLDTPILCQRLFCYIYRANQKVGNSNQIFKKLPKNMIKSPSYSVSFELQARSGQVYYLIKIIRVLGAIMNWEDAAELGSKYKDSSTVKAQKHLRK